MAGFVLLSYLAAASWWDIKERRIPNKLVAAGLVLGLALKALGLGPTDAWTAFVVVFVFMFAAYCVNSAGLGGGDVKLVAVAALFLGVSRALAALAVGFILCGAYGLARCALKRGSLKSSYPLAPFFAAGAVAALLLV